MGNRNGKLEAYIGVQLLLDVDAVGGGEEIVEEDVEVAQQVEGEVVEGRHHRPAHHHVHRRLDGGRLADAVGDGIIKDFRML